MVEGRTLGMSRAEMDAKLRLWAEAGATWLLESLYDVPDEDSIARLREGPPDIDL